MHEVGRRHVRLVDLHEVDVHEEWLVRRLAAVIEIVEGCFLDVLVEERNADDASFPACSHTAPLILKSSFAVSPALPDIAPLVTLANMARSSGSMSGNQVGSA